MFTPVPNLAAPSCVIPGDVAVNAAFLLGKIRGISLCLFETAACLAYGPTDLPPWLAETPFQWHIHLPLDLPWTSGGKAVAAICGRLLAMTSFLKPVAAVLHPPREAARTKLLAEFSQNWKSPAPVALENVPWCDILELGTDFLTENGYSFCLDVGHALGYAQENLLDSPLPAKAAIWHWHAPGAGDQHLPLSRLTNAQKALAAMAMSQADRKAIHVLEIFRWRGILDSIPLIQSLAGSLRGEHDI